MRIVSTTCSNTEILCALGAAELLVGVDDYSDFPPAVVARLPRVGPDLGIDVAKVAELQPDIVLASLTVPGHERVVQALTAAGLPVLAPEPVSLADIRRDIREIARAIGVPERGEILAREFAAAMVPHPTGRVRPRIVVEWWPKPVIVPGGRSWVTELIELAGGTNPFGRDDVKSRPIEPDELRRADPDAFVISWCGIEPAKYRPDVVLQRPGCETLRAVRERRVFVVPEAHLGRPGPRLTRGLADLRRVVTDCGQGAGGARAERGGVG
jgi:iron complex transport system substrate-binding protein